MLVIFPWLVTLQNASIFPSPRRWQWNRRYSASLLQLFDLFLIFSVCVMLKFIAKRLLIHTRVSWESLIRSIMLRTNCCQCWQSSISIIEQACKNKILRMWSRPKTLNFSWNFSTNNRVISLNSLILFPGQKGPDQKGYNFWRVFYENWLQKKTDKTKRSNLMRGEW